MNYEQWNQAIISYFFEECNPGEIVFLQTDDETLSEIAELSNFSIENPADSLKQAVRGKFICDGSRVESVVIAFRKVLGKSSEPRSAASCLPRVNCPCRIAHGQCR